MRVDILLTLYFLLDDPLAILEEIFESVNHVLDSVLDSDPDNPRRASEPSEEGEHSTELPLDETCRFKHHCVIVPVDCEVVKVG